MNCVAGSEPELKNALLCIAEVIANPEWKIKEGESETSGIEHAGLHMILKKLAQHDSVALQTSKRTFGECLCSKITDETVTIFQVSISDCCKLFCFRFRHGYVPIEDVFFWWQLSNMDHKKLKMLLRRRC